MTPQFKSLQRKSAEAAKWAACIVALTFATCCANYPRPVPNQTSEIGFMVKPEINVRFKRIAGGDYNAIVQEIVFDNGSALVECFRCEPGDTVWDRHTWSAENEVRYMKCYLAKVEGVDWNDVGFAHLPANMDGSVKTNVGPGFNFAYQASHETRGKVTRMSKEYFTWSISSGLQRMYVEAP